MALPARCLTLPLTVHLLRHFTLPPRLQFYERVYADETPWFKAVFATSPKQVAIRNQ